MYNDTGSSRDGPVQPQSHNQYESCDEIVATINGRRYVPKQDHDVYNDLVREKWSHIIIRHAEFTREISAAYSRARFNKKPIDYHSCEMQYVIDLCQQDIALAEDYKQYLMSLKRPLFEHEKAYPSFRTLAIIYEKQKDYEFAIAVCEHAIELGFTCEAGSKTDMLHRLNRLIAKQSKSHLQSIAPAAYTQPPETNIPARPP